jgi:hypothetical protein
MSVPLAAAVLLVLALLPLEEGALKLGHLCPLWSSVGGRRNFWLLPSLLSTGVMVSAAFLKVPAISKVVCLFRLCTSLKPSSSIFGCPVCCFNFRTAFNPFSVTLHVAYSALNSVFPLRDLQ